MRTTLMASAAALCLGFAAPALAQQATAMPPPATADQNAPAATDAAPPDTTTAPSMSAPKKMHHHVMHTAATGENWAHQPGTGESGPASAKASNIDQADSRSDIAPHFQSPEIGENAGPAGYLKAAERALSQHKTGEAQQALEMAETRLLDRSTPATDASAPDQSGMVKQVSMARQALGHNDTAGARKAIQMALSAAPVTSTN